MFNTKKYHHDYYLAHREEAIKNRHQYYLDHQSEIIKKAKLYRVVNKERDAEKWRERDRLRRKLNREFYNFGKRLSRFRKRLKLMEILNQYVCVKCGEGDYRCLQFDHMNAGGNKDRLKHSGRNDGREMIRYYVSHPEEARLKLQLLCANCNTKKSRNV